MRYLLENADDALKQADRRLQSGDTKEARELGEAIQQLARGDEEDASKTLKQSTFTLERGKRASGEAPETEEIDDEGGDEE